MVECLLRDDQHIGAVVDVGVGIYPAVAQQLVELLLGRFGVGRHEQLVGVERVHACIVIYSRTQVVLYGEVQVLLYLQRCAVLLPLTLHDGIPVLLGEHTRVIAVEGQSGKVVNLVLGRTSSHQHVVHIAAHACGRLVVGSLLTQLALHDGIALREGAQHAHHPPRQGRAAVLHVIAEEHSL